jgi:hypothetical protein
MFGAPKVVAPACVYYGPCQLGPEEEESILYWRIRDLWGPTYLVALGVDESDDTLPYLQGVH